MTKIYSPDTPAIVELVGIEGEELFNDDGSPMTMSVLGEDSDVAVSSRNASSNRRLAQGARLKMTQEGFNADSAAYLSKIVTDWNITPNKLVPGVDAGLGDGKVAYSRAAAVTIFSNPKLTVIRDQPDRAASERGRFLTA